jgi:hypothetical protein
MTDQIQRFLFERTNVRGEIEALLVSPDGLPPTRH